MTRVPTAFKPLGPSGGADVLVAHPSRIMGCLDGRLLLSAATAAAAATTAAAAATATTTAAAAVAAAVL